MHVTKHAAELCALAIGDIYGELPSRVLASLLARGRSSVQQLSQYTMLPSRQVRHGLALLVQQNLLYYQVETPTITTYEANAGACYNVLRSGKIVAMIGHHYGVAEQEIVQSLMVLGHAKVADLEQAFSSRIKLGKCGKASHGLNGQSLPATDGSCGIESTDQLHRALNRLLENEIVEEVGPWSFESPDNVYERIKQRVTKSNPGDKSAPKTKVEQQRELLRLLGEERDRGKRLKRQLDRTAVSFSKKRKLGHGLNQNIYSVLDEPGISDLNVIIRVNEQRCLVHLRNQQLTNFAADTLGESTGKVYHAVLCLLAASQPKCRLNSKTDPEYVESENGAGSRPIEGEVSTMDVYHYMDSSAITTRGIGKTSTDKIDTQSAEKIRRVALQNGIDTDGSDMEDNLLEADIVGQGGEEPGANRDSSDNEDEGDVITRRPRKRIANSHPGRNSSRETKVKFDRETTTKDNSRLESLRQHLLLLAESKYRFIRHCGVQDHGKWTIDFEPLIESLRQAEVDAIVERSFGRGGLRLTRILRDKGKLDDKSLPLLALMKKSDVQTTMLAMQAAGFVDVQEVPRGSTHKARESIHLRFFDLERTQGHVLDNVYKAMVRCLQTLAVHRHQEKNILSFVERKDVRGKEADVMQSSHYNQYNRHLELQSKLIGQLMRLDELVAILRDY